ncbi:hypothetical protein M434DRAFT_38104 [Hypoxylon sp. CO27-5]|nr:hypothetical protein M434DRAFT_38104 [Hypoxylon sp. CO27-5]
MLWMRHIIDQASNTIQFLAKERSPSTGKVFNHRRQAIRLFFKFFGRWLLTAMICAAFTGVLKAYDRKPYIEDRSTQIYNSIAAGLTICLSLNIASSLNAFAAAFKWVLLARKPFQPRVFDLVLDFDKSKANAVKLLFWRGETGWCLRLVCLVWLFIALAAQVGTALIGLAYSVVPLSIDSADFPTPRGRGFTSIFTQIGSHSLTVDNVSFPIEPENTPYNLTVQRSNAFAYGIGAINSPIYKVTWPDAFSFHTTAYDEESEAYFSAITNYPTWSQNTPWNAIGRGVKNYARCIGVDASMRDSSNFSDTSAITFDGYNGTQTFTITKAPLDYVTYISDTNSSCGARCTQVYVIIAANRTTDLFICNSTVRVMYDWLSNDLILNGSLSMPDPQARILAGAIGWGDIEVDDSLSTPGRFQASSFPYGSYWASSSLTPSNGSVGNLFVAHFTAATIEVMSQYGLFEEFPNIIVPGIASELDVKWMYSDLILSLIPAFQGLLALSCIYGLYRYRVPIHDDSPLAMGTLLTPVVSHIPTGTLQSGSRMTKDMKVDIVYMPEGDRSSNKVKIASTDEWGGKKAFREWS